MRRSHSRRLTLRGRLTLVALGLAVSLGLGILLDPLPWFGMAPGSRRDGVGQVRSGTSDVSAAPPSAATRPPIAPLSVLARLPGPGAEPDVVDVAVRALDTPGPRLAEWLPVPEDATPDLPGPLRVEYAVDAELTRRVERVLRRARIRRGHAIVLDPETGRVLAYVSTDAEAFPPEGAYPAASLVKIVTAAAALDADPEWAERACRYAGNPYRLRPSQVHPPRRGHEISLERALAMSNNHCFAQLAVHHVGGPALRAAIERFGWLQRPAPGHEPGEIEEVESDYDLGRLGCGLDGCRITALHAAQLAATLAEGLRVEPWWIHRVSDGAGRALAIPGPSRPKRVLTPELASRLRTWLVRTTRRGTARSAFHDRRGRPRLGSIEVAGKTGNLTGRQPRGRYEWFAGLAPADDPRVAVAVVQLHDDLWWQNSSSVAAGVLEQVFCERQRCDADLARRFTGDLDDLVAPAFLSQTGH